MIAALALALAQASPQPAAPAVAEARRQEEGRAYRALVERYRAGDRAGAVAAPLPPEQARRVVSELRQLAETAICVRCPAEKRVQARDRLDAFPLQAAVLLHTERALDRLETDDPAAEEELGLGLPLIVLMRDDRRRGFEPRWLGAAALGLNRLGRWDLALSLLAPALARYPGEARLHLARGAALEARARMALDSLPAGRGLGGRRRTASAVRDDLVQAERSCREALEVQPDLSHARVRLGRVRTLLGREDGMADLRAVAAGEAEVRDRYLAHLFLGHAHEAAGRFGEAAAAYGQALRIDPAGQAGAVALSHALHRQGRAAESAQALRSGVARAGRRAVDPWWPYVSGQWEDADAAMDALRAEASR